MAIALPCLIPTVGVGRDAGGRSHLLEAEAAPVSEHEVGRRVVGHEEIDETVFIEVGGDDPEPGAFAVDSAGLVRYVDEPATVIAEPMIGPGVERSRVAILDSLGGPGLAVYWVTLTDPSSSIARLTRFDPREIWTLIPEVSGLASFSGARNR